MFIAPVFFPPLSHGVMGPLTCSTRIKFKLGSKCQFQTCWLCETILSQDLVGSLELYNIGAFIILLLFRSKINYLIHLKVKITLLLTFMRSYVDIYRLFLLKFKFYCQDWLDDLKVL